MAASSSYLGDSIWNNKALFHNAMSMELRSIGLDEANVIPLTTIICNFFGTASSFVKVNQSQLERVIGKVPMPDDRKLEVLLKLSAMQEGKLEGRGVRCELHFNYPLFFC